MRKQEKKCNGLAGSRHQLGNLGHAWNRRLMGYATEGGARQGVVPVSAFLGLPALGRDSGKRDIPRQTRFRTFLSSPASSYLHVANTQTATHFFSLSNSRLWNQYMFISEILGLQNTYKSSLLLQQYAIYVCQLISQTYFKFFGFWF